MPKNVVIFSDGTGQAGGFRFDENRSNIYKLYRATRCAPDSVIDPREQVTFYDPGLGSQGADAGRHLFGRVTRRVYNLISQATGFGITANIIDCYAALIRLWHPGDRILLFGFSRGAYTIRCLAGVISFCGIPRREKGGAPLKLDAASSRKIAENAVKHVYQFTSSRPPRSATPRQQFLLHTRALLGKRFREEHGSAADEKANVYPYFIGVFDTVASLGSFRKSAMFTAMFLAFTMVVALAAEYLSFFDEAPVIGRVLGALSFGRALAFMWAVAAITAAVVYVYTHVKFDFAVPGYTREENLRTLHLTELWQRFYDYDLNENVGYAKHAISIDENRKDFARVPWGRPDSRSSGCWSAP